MDNKKDDEYYISQVIENIDAIISYSEGQQYEEFIKDGKSIDAIMFHLSKWPKTSITYRANSKRNIKKFLGMRYMAFEIGLFMNMAKPITA